MWTNIVGGMALLFVATYVIQFFYVGTTKTKGGRPRTRWDVPPIVGFFGILLLGLSFLEALRGTVLQAWGLGIGIGIVIGVSLWFARAYRPGSSARPRESRIRMTIRILRTFGPPILVLSLATYIAIRIIGAMVAVFVAGLLGVLLLMIAALLLAEAVRGKMENG